MSTRAPINIKRNKYYEEAKDFCIYTPLDLSYYLYDLLRVREISRILDICCGEGNLSIPYYENEKKIVGVDTKEKIDFSIGEFISGSFVDNTDKEKEITLLTAEEKHNKIGLLEDKSNKSPSEKSLLKLLKSEIPSPINEQQVNRLKEFDPELILSNPPFNGCSGRRLYPFEILKKIVEIYGYHKPIILFTLMGFRLNRRYGAERETVMEDYFEKGLKITSVISMPIDTFFPGSKTNGQQWEILIFNLPELEPHYWYTVKTRNNMIKKYGLY